MNYIQYQLVNKERSITTEIALISAANYSWKQ